MKKVAFAISALALLGNMVPADCLRTGNEPKIRREIKDKNVNYGDVSSSVDCKYPTTQNEGLICSSSKLLLMEILDTKSYVYALEKGTNQKANHQETYASKWKIKV
jgi:hypothetical protein